MCSNCMSSGCQECKIFNLEKLTLFPVSHYIAAFINFIFYTVLMSNIVVMCLCRSNSL